MVTLKSTQKTPNSKSFNWAEKSAKKNSNSNGHISGIFKTRRIMFCCVKICCSGASFDYNKPIMIQPHQELSQTGSLKQTHIVLLKKFVIPPPLRLGDFVWQSPILFLAKSYKMFYGGQQLPGVKSTKLSFRILSTRIRILSTENSVQITPHVSRL